MKEKNYLKFFIIFIFLVVVINTFILLKPNITGNVIKESQNPEKVIENLYNAIDIAKEEGNYKCCIEPDCTMCYLGNWKFEKGTCFCDDAILEGRFDDVCPECKSGIEEGLCTSTREEGCILDPIIFGGEKR